MRHTELRQQPLQQQAAQPRAQQHDAGAPASTGAPGIDGSLDKAAALWTTRRVRNCLVLLDPLARPAHR